MKGKEFFIPIICASCGDRLGWQDDRQGGKITALMYCDSCAESDES